LDVGSFDLATFPPLFQLTEWHTKKKKRVSWIQLREKKSKQRVNQQFLWSWNVNVIEIPVQFQINAK
jgi:hypothetical protein